jgi:hypothetical protein
LPADFPPWQTVYWYFVRWEQQRVTLTMLDTLRRQVRVADGRDPEPSAGIIDSQSVKGADTVGRESRGCDAGKKINGRKRFIVTDTLGLLITVTVCAASVQDRDGAKGALLGLFLTATRCRFVFADAGFAGRLIEWAKAVLHTIVAVVRKPAGQKGFQVLPRPVGGRKNPGLADIPPPPGTRLRTPPGHRRSHDPLGRHQHHDPPTGTRQACLPTRTTPPRIQLRSTSQTLT